MGAFDGDIINRGYDSDSSNISGDLNMKNHKIINAKDPNKTNNQEITTVGFVKQNYLDKNLGGTLLASLDFRSDANIHGRLNMQDSHIIGLNDNPISQKSAINKNFVDNNFLKKNQRLDAVNKELVNVGTPLNDTDATNKLYCDSNFHKKNQNIVVKAKVVDLQDPTDDTDGVNKKYVENNFFKKGLDIDMKDMGIANLAYLNIDSAAVPKKYIERDFIMKGQDIDMQKKTIKNVQLNNDATSAVPRSYVDQKTSYYSFQRL